MFLDAGGKGREDRDDDDFLRKAILNGHEVIPVKDPIEWARWYEIADRHVALTVVNRRRRIVVSTVFLGINHSFFGRSRPLWFETMVFGTSIDGEQERYETWDEAELGHAKMLRRAMQARHVRFHPVDFRKVMKRWRRR